VEDRFLFHSWSTEIYIFTRGCQLQITSVRLSLCVLRVVKNDSWFFCRFMFF